MKKKEQTFKEFWKKAEQALSANEEIQVYESGEILMWKYPQKIASKYGANFKTKGLHVKLKIDRSVRGMNINIFPLGITQPYSNFKLALAPDYDPPYKNYVIQDSSLSVRVGTESLSSSCTWLFEKGNESSVIEVENILATLIAVLSTLSIS